MTHLRLNVLRMVGIVWYNKEEKLLELLFLKMNGF